MLLAILLMLEMDHSTSYTLEKVGCLFSTLKPEQMVCIKYIYKERQNKQAAILRTGWMAADLARTYLCSRYM